VELIEAIRGRRSIRKYLKKDVDMEIVKKVIDAAQWAPSACDRQLWEFVVVTEQEIKERLVREAKGHFFLKNAPVLIYVLYPKDINPEEHANVQSASAAIQNMLLTAYSLGLGTCWVVASGKRDKVRKILSIPEQYLIVAAIAMGYPGEELDPPPRRNVEEIIHLNKFEKKKAKMYDIDPEMWDIGEVAQYRMRGIRSTSPFGHSHSFPFKREFQVEMELIKENLDVSGRSLDVLDFAGTYLLNIVKETGLKDAYMIEMKSPIIKFIKKKKQNMKVKNKIEFSIGNPYRMPFKDKTFDNVFCFKELEKIPKTEDLIKEISRVIKPGGTFYLSFWKTTNIYGLNYFIKTKIMKNRATANHYGPIKPLKPGSAKKNLKSNGFVIEKEYGINLMPNKGPLSYFNTEGYKSKGLSRVFCRTLWLKCRKMH